MRRTILIAALLGALLLPACALAKSVSASAGGVTATLSYSGGPGITTKDERLTIRQHGKLAYDQPVPSSGCAGVCGPGPRRPVQIADLYGDGSEEVALNLFSNGADCCAIEQIYVYSAALQSYVLSQHNFGEAGAVIRDIGPAGRGVFVSANSAFYCEFTFCAGSVLPLQILEFNDGRFIDITRQYPKLVAADAAKWLKLYYKSPAQGKGVIAAWAADEDNLGSSGRATARTVLQLQTADGHLPQGFVASLERFLAKHHYT